MFAFLLSSLGSLLIVISPNYMSAIVSLFMIGCGMAMLQVVVNPLLRTAGGEENYANFSVWAQLIFGSASYLSPFVYQSFILQKNYPSIKLVGLRHFSNKYQTHFHGFPFMYYL